MKVVIRLLLATLALHVFGFAHAQAYPDKPIRLIVTYPPGGSTDTVGRAVAHKLSEILKNPVVVENRAGASGTIGVAHAAKAAPDGYTLLLVAGAHAVAENIYPNRGYDLAKDFDGVSLVARSGYLMVLNPSLPVSSVQDVIALAKKKPGELNYASTGTGGTPHLAAELFSSMTGTKMTAVQYKGDAPAIVDLIGGRVDLAFLGISSVSTHVASGKLKALAVTTAQRTSAMPELPTLDEAGVKGYDFGTWWGVLAPRGTPRPIIEQLSQAMKKVVAFPDLRERFTALGLDADSSGPNEFGAFVASEVKKYGKIADDAGLKPQ
jgi:tripartite-type tricarboxylate transporter receptor subunit TctC